MISALSILFDLHPSLAVCALVNVDGLELRHAVLDAWPLVSSELAEQLSRGFVSRGQKRERSELAQPRQRAAFKELIQKAAVSK